MYYDRKAVLKWQAKNPAKVKAANRAKNLRFYGLTEDHYEALLILQGGHCALCRSTRGSSRAPRLFVDHCHATGFVRGLLCHRCNYLIGYAQDDADLLSRAERYLRRASGG